MEASAESNGGAWRRKRSAEAIFSASLALCSVHRSRTSGPRFSSGRWRLPKANGRKSEDGESERAAILRGGILQRQIDIDTACFSEVT